MSVGGGRGPCLNTQVLFACMLYKKSKGDEGKLRGPRNGHNKACPGGEAHRDCFPRAADPPSSHLFTALSSKID